MRIGLVGDSQGAGLKGPLEALLPAQGDTLVGAAVQVGAPLRTLARLAESLPRGLDVAVIVCGGGNDTSSLSSPERWDRDVRDLVAAVRARSPRSIVWVGPFPAREGISGEAARSKLAARAGIDTALEGLGVRRIDGFELARGLPPSSPDGLHFSAASYRAIAERLAPELRAQPLSPFTVVLAAVGGLAGLGALAWAFTRRK